MGCSCRTFREERAIAFSYSTEVVTVVTDSFALPLYWRAP